MQLPHDQRRYDGHVGRHDCLYFPHYFAPEMPHWPFMRRPSMVRREDPEYMAYRPLIQVWRRDTSDLFSGSFSPDFITELNAYRRVLDLRYGELQKIFKST